MKKLLFLFCSVCLCLPVLAATLQGNVEQKISTIKCEIVDDNEVSIKIKGYPFPPNKEKKQDKYDLILIIDDTNKKVMNNCVHGQDSTKW